MPHQALILKKKNSGVFSVCNRKKLPFIISQHVQKPTRQQLKSYDICVEFRVYPIMSVLNTYTLFVINNQGKSN